jgi:hypothetical protein
MPPHRRNLKTVAIGATLTALLATGITTVVLSASPAQATPPSTSAPAIAPAINPAVTSQLRPADGVSTLVAPTVRHAKVVRHEKLRYKVTRRQVSTLPAGTKRLLAAGRSGVARVTYRVTYVNGKVAHKTKIASRVLVKPRARVIAIGVRSRGVEASPAVAMSIAKQLLKARGWSSQFSCLAQMWGRESGWNLHASNASGAYGIPQALPGAKMAAMGGSWANDAQTQIKWGLNYIAGRYGTPCHAWSLWQSQGWY